MVNDNRLINDIYNNGLNDAYGQLPPSQNLLLKTGQTTSYATGDDGDLENGLDLPVVRFEETNIAGVDLVIDHHTGLMWPKTVIQDVTEMSWYSALTAVNALSLAGFSDWRMPNVLEMMSRDNNNTDDDRPLGRDCKVGRELAPYFLTHDHAGCFAADLAGAIFLRR